MRKEKLLTNERKNSEKNEGKVEEKNKQTKIRKK